jgi:hypothetical protein
MAKDSDHLAGTLGTENTGGVLSGFLAEENQFDRRTLWRLGSWAAGAVGALTVAVLANQSSLGFRRDQLAAADLSRQAQQLQSLTRESQSETRRLASAVDTLNGDHDRLYSRVTVLEQGLEQVTGAIARQTPAAASGQQVAAKPSPTPTPSSTPVAAEPTPTASPAQAATAPPPNPAPVTTTTAFGAERPRTEVSVAPPSQPQSQPAQPQPQPQSQPQTQAAAAAASLPKIVAKAPTEPLTGPKSLMGPPDPAASKLIEPAKMANAAPPVDQSQVPTVERSAAPTAEKDAAAPVEKEKAAAVAPTPASDAEAPDSALSKVQRTEFAIDLGSANSVGGLRALWRGLLKVNSELVSLHPIIVVKERTTGLGMQLRLAAGPLSDAAAAAKICAALIESERGCETTVFDGQRLTMQADETPRATTPPPAAKARQWRHGTQRRTGREEPVPAAKPESTSTFSSLFGRYGK